MNRIFITGITGQLGTYLTKLYLKKGYKIFGGIRRSANWNPWRLKAAGLFDNVEFLPIDLADQSSLDRAVETSRPDLVINTAAQSFVAASWQIGVYTLDVTGTGVFRLLESVKKYAPEARFLQMSSSELFGNNPNVPYNEHSIFMPRSPYAIAKAVGYYSVVNFRESYDLFASNLISFNFESPLRGHEFVTQKIVQHAVQIYKAFIKGVPFQPLRLGNLDATRDWIWAGDTARAVEMIMNYSKSDDFCIASGQTTSVRQFCEMVFSFLEMPLQWTKSNPESDNVIQTGSSGDKELVISDKKFYRPADVPHLIGDASKAKKELGWKPTKTLLEIIQEMVSFEMSEGKNLVIP